MALDSILLDRIEKCALKTYGAGTETTTAGDGALPGATSRFSAITDFVWPINGAS